jgi:hypothetical protein
VSEDEVANWINRPRDTEEKVTARLNSLKGLRTELEKAYGVRTTDSSSGIFQEIKSDGLGENSEHGIQPTLEKVFEVVESALIRPVPVSYKYN